MKDPVEIDSPPRTHARLWIKINQLSRRNLTDDQRAIVADEVREERSALAVREKLQRARDVKAGRPMEATLSPIEPKERTRKAVSREAKIPERKLRAAAEVNRTSKTRPSRHQRHARRELHTLPRSCAR